MKWLVKQSKNNSGFTLVEVLISMMILSIVVAAALNAFVFTTKITDNNRFKMTAMNLANDRVEYIRSLKFAEVGTKTEIGGTTVYGDPKGEIMQSEIVSVGHTNYLIKTIINWEDHDAWGIGELDWDYKSVKIEVLPQVIGHEEELKQTVETYLARDSSQPPLTGSNIALRITRGWKEDPTDEDPVSNISVGLRVGPSAPRQVLTSSKGIARFIDLDPGTYTVHIDPSSAGMIQMPDEPEDWNIDLQEDTTEVEEFTVEYPCYLKINLRSLEGNLLNSSAQGKIKLDVPYGTDIEKEFTVGSSSCLQQDFLGGLWPVGTGYADKYTVTDIVIPDSTYLGAYEVRPTGDTVWPGTFSAPGTVKEITCYFGVTPDTPSNIDANWVDGGGAIMTDSGPYLADNAEFSTANTEDRIIMQRDKSSDYNATHGIYFENTGTDTNPGLYLGNRSQLWLHSGLVIFRGKIELEHAEHSTDRGMIALRTVFSDGSQANAIPGSEIGGTADVSKMYGKIYLVKPIVQDGIEIVKAGGYYFYDGLTLPGDASELIPITKENFVN